MYSDENGDMQSFNALEILAEGSRERERRMEKAIRLIIRNLTPETPLGQMFICSDALHPTDDDKTIVDYLIEAIK